MGCNSPSAVATLENTLKRSSANFHPCLWGDHFLSFSPEFLTVDAWKKEAASLKEKVREKFINLLGKRDGLGEQLKLIDVIQRLGVAYHFEEEIDETLNKIFHNHHLQEEDDDNLFISALRFRLLREHGYKCSSDVFNKFKEGKNKFKEGGDVQALLSLYEAANLRVHGEDILERALDFTTAKLKEMAPHLQPSLAKQVHHALYRPMRKALPRVYARDFMSFYEQDDFHDQILLKFAKIDFNILQKQHQEELSIISRWWRSLDVVVNFPFARDRIAEGYFWMISAYFEPKYSFARMFFSKIIAMASILDDIFDNVFGIQAELDLFNQAIQRWDINAMDKLPKYMKLWFQALLEVYDEVEEELANTGRSFALCYAKDSMKDAVNGYHEESKWRQLLFESNRARPTMEQYTKMAFATTCYQMLAISSLVGMGEIATKEAFDWLLGGPQMLQAACLICRFMDDIAGHQFEQQREHVPSAVECYMDEKGVSEEEACKELNEQIKEAWKDLNEAFLDPQSPPMPILMRVLNLTRVMELMYKEEDGYTHSAYSKPYLLSLLVDPLEL